MNRILTAALSAAVLCGSLFAGETEFKLEKNADWKISRTIKWTGEKKNVMEAHGSASLSSVKLFDINDAKKYTLKADAKVISGGPAYVFVGFEPYTKDGRAIPCEAVNVRIGSETVVAKAAEKGAVKLILKANAQWKRPGIISVVLNPKKDYSDLPNFNYLSCSAYKVVGGNVEVTLRKPLAAAIAAGTAVRGHVDGGFMYAAGFKKLADGESFEFKGSAKGRSKLSMGRHNWAPGAAKARIIILVNWGNNKAVTQIKDVKLEIEK